MRLWHKDLIDVLPRQQLIGQWRECCLIARQIQVYGHPNHILVEPIMNYPLAHFDIYTKGVIEEIASRGYRVNIYCYIDQREKLSLSTFEAFVPSVDYCRIFKDWHDLNYMRQCYYNLQEKYMRGGMSEDEWQKVDQKVRRYGAI